MALAGSPENQHSSTPNQLSNDTKINKTDHSTAESVECGVVVKPSLSRKIAMTQEEHHDYRLVELPGYVEWSRQQLHDGESEALIAHLDSTSAWLSKTDVEALANDFFDELLDELKEELKRSTNCMALFKDIESQLRSYSHLVAEGQLRLFGCDCCQRLLSLCNDSILYELISFGRTRSIRQVDGNEINLLRCKSDHVYNSIYPGFGDPSAKVLAISAGGEVAFTDSALGAAINASAFAAEAVAKNASLQASHTDYDSVFELAYASERRHQWDLLVKYIPDAKVQMVNVQR